MIIPILLLMLMQIQHDKPPTKADELKEINARLADKCSGLEDLQNQVKNIQSEREGVTIQLMCSVPMGHQSDTITPLKYPLSKSEIDKIHVLRLKSDLAFTSQTAYENELIRKYVPGPYNHPHAYGDPCYHFIGFILDDEFITEDWTMASSMCPIPTKAKVKK